MGSSFIPITIRHLVYLNLTCLLTHKVDNRGTLPMWLQGINEVIFVTTRAVSSLGCNNSSKVFWMVEIMISV